MPAPSAVLRGFRPDLGALFQFNQLMNRMGFIGNMVAPVFEAAEQAGSFGLVPLKELLKEPQTGRNNRGEYNRTNYTFRDEVYATKEQGLEVPVDERQARIYREYLDFEAFCTANILDSVLRAAEKRIADMMFNATTFTSQKTTITNEWNDFANATPIDDINAAVTAIWNRTGQWANALIINRHVFRNLRQCDQITDKIASSGAGGSIEPGKITVAQLASCFDLPKIIVAGSARDTANEGQAVSISSVWSSEYAMVAKVAETNTIEEPCIARTIHWGADGSTIGGTIERYYEDTVRGDVIRVRHETQERVMYLEMAQLFDNVTTL